MTTINQQRRDQWVLRLAIAATITIFALFAATLAMGDTLRLAINSADYNDGTAYVGPYHSTVSFDGGPTDVAWSYPVTTYCVDYTSHVGFGQAFDIQAYSLADYTGPLLTEYREAGYLALQIQSITDLATISNYQRAIWQITTPGSTDPYLFSPTINALVNDAQAHYQSVDPSQFVVYIKTGSEGQNQLSVVPEPGTNMLIGAAALVAFGLWRKPRIYP